MNDSTDKFDRGQNIEDTLRNEAQRIPATEQATLVEQVMHSVRSSPRRAVDDHPERTSGWIPWLMAGATATAAVVVTIVLTSSLEDSSPSNLPRQANLPRLVESSVDPVLASREQDLAGELKRIRADLDSIGRMVSIRLESDSE